MLTLMLICLCLFISCLGVKMKIVTGDHFLIAKEVSRQLNIGMDKVHLVCVFIHRCSLSFMSHF